MRTNPLRTAYRLNPPEYCVPKGGCHPKICILLVLFAQLVKLVKYSFFAWQWQFLRTFEFTFTRFSNGLCFNNFTSAVDISFACIVFLLSNIFLPMIVGFFYVFYHCCLIVALIRQFGYCFRLVSHVHCHDLAFHTLCFLLAPQCFQSHRVS